MLSCYIAIEAVFLTCLSVFLTCSVYLWARLSVSSVCQWQHNVAGLLVVDVVVDPHLSVHLRSHQRDGIIFLYQSVMAMKPYRGCGAILAWVWLLVVLCHLLYLMLWSLCSQIMLLIISWMLFLYVLDSLLLNYHCVCEVQTSLPS